MEWSKAAYHLSLFTMFYSNLMKNRSFLLPYIYGPLISLHILERNDKNINNRRVPMTGAVTWGKLNQVIMLLIFVRFNINQTAPPFLFGMSTFVQWIYVVCITILIKWIYIFTIQVMNNDFGIIEVFQKIIRSQGLRTIYLCQTSKSL